MRHFPTFTLYSFVLLLTLICSAAVKAQAQPAPLMGCEVLLEKAQDSRSPLQRLAALRAARLCAGPPVDLSSLSELEKKLFSAEISALPKAIPNEPSAPPSAEQPADTAPKLSLEQQIKSEKNPTEKLRLYKQLRADYKKQQKKEKYLKVTDEMSRWARQLYKKKTGETEYYSVAYEAAQLAARAHWTENRTEQAKKILQESVHLLKRHRSVAELYFLQGRIADEEKKYTDAVRYYELAAADVKKYSPADISFKPDRVAWLRAWILYKEKKYPEAESAFNALAENTTDLSEKSRALFFKSRCLSYLKAPELAKKSLQQIIDQDFFGYYSLVAHRELGRKFAALSTYKKTEPSSWPENLNFLTTLEHKLFTALAESGEYELAEKLISVLERPQPEELALTIYLAEKHRFYMPLFRTFARLDNTAKFNVFVTHPDLIFPQPHSEIVAKMSEKTQLRPSLIYSIMKQESGFNPKARSAADAFGLMQVIPPLARQLAKKFSVPYSTETDLYSPEINIQLGALELMQQVGKQKGQLSFVAAAYNAGPEALAQWRKTRARDDLVEFIEEIPYEETRTYVKLITRNLLFYERVSKRNIEHDFPSEFLNSL